MPARLSFLRNDRRLAIRGHCSVSLMVTPNNLKLVTCSTLWFDISTRGGGCCLRRGPSIVF